jgi:hypothetical protein
METEMELTLEELDAIEGNPIKAGDYEPIIINHRNFKKLIAAARAHLEGQEKYCLNDEYADVTAERIIPQPPQQREDEPSFEQFLDEIEKRPPNDRLKRLMRDNPSPDAGLVAASLNIVAGHNPSDLSPDAGLVERLQISAQLGCPDTPAIYAEAAAALEAKDAEILDLATELKGEGILRAKLSKAQAEIERLRKALEEIISSDELTFQSIARAALKGGD